MIELIIPPILATPDWIVGLIAVLLALWLFVWVVMKVVKRLRLRSHNRKDSSATAGRGCSADVELPADSH